MPRPPKMADPRGALLASARTLLLRHGPEGVSLRAVAKHAGFGAASVYGYFAGHEALLDALAAAASVRLAASLRPVLVRRLGPTRALVHLGEAYVRFAQEHHEDFQVMFLRLPSARRSLAEAVPPDGPYAMLAGCVARAASAAGCRWTQTELEHVTYGFWAAVHGMAVLQCTHLRGFGANFRRADQRTLEALVAGFGLLPNNHRKRRPQ